MRAHLVTLVRMEGARLSTDMEMPSPWPRLHSLSIALTGPDQSEISIQNINQSESLPDLVS